MKMGTEIVKVEPQDVTDVVKSYTQPFESRQERARKACEAAGIVWPGTILPPGTALYSSGVEKLKSDRAAWQRLPIASEVVVLAEARAKHRTGRAA